MLNDWSGVRLEDEDDFCGVYESEFDYDKAVINTRMRFFVKEEDGRYSMVEESHMEKGYTRETMEKL